MRALLTWIAWVLLSFAAALPGAVSPPGEWYAALSKPDWTPAGQVFPVVWSTLYFCMGTAAWLVQRAGNEERPVRGPLALFSVQLVLNAAWTPIFFGLHAIFPALVVIVVLWGAILATLIAFGRVSTPAAWLFAPYLAWVSVAVALNFQIWRSNA